MDEKLFNPSLLYDLDFSTTSCTFKPTLGPKEPGEGLVMRPLERSDYAKGFLNLLSQLTKVGSVDGEQFVEQFERMKKSSNHYVVVIEDVIRSRIVASATLLVEYKFIHGAAMRGRIEDLVVSDRMRGKQLGKLLVETLLKLAVKLGCYKLSLDADDQVKSFYEKFGFRDGATLFMQLRFFD
ncbi:glucosamine 6-phosphate N-acetyltransferase-like [Oscarella lobularis]|uniref:glucosamine 6-phosphate N-acetyltransferase-like n=1 Tax=Oscarella lobularis TaxID=121494 RepID=UPI0033140400